MMEAQIVFDTLGHNSIFTEVIIQEDLCWFIFETDKSEIKWKRIKTYTGIHSFLPHNSGICWILLAIGCFK
jgi:hypothetical protein